MRGETAIERPMNRENQQNGNDQLEHLTIDLAGIFVEPAAAASVAAAKKLRDSGSDQSRRHGGLQPHQLRVEAARGVSVHGKQVRADRADW